MVLFLIAFMLTEASQFAFKLSLVDSGSGEAAIVWGFIDFLLNYIPNMGSIIAGIPPVLFALADHGLSTALGVSMLYVIVNQGFGTIGMLLSAPLTMALRIVFEQFPETRGLVTMLAAC